jgi:putative transposase
MGGTATALNKPDDYDTLVAMMAKASVRVPMRILAYCLMPNHFRLSLWPCDDGDLGRWMHWLLATHVRRCLWHYRSSANVWRGRFKAFSISIS